MANRAKRMQLAVFSLATRHRGFPPLDLPGRSLSRYGREKGVQSWILVLYGQAHPGFVVRLFLLTSFPLH